MNQTDFITDRWKVSCGKKARPEYLNDIPKEDRRLPFTFEEVLETLWKNEKNSFKVEDLDESEGFSEGDTIKIRIDCYLLIKYQKSEVSKIHRSH